MSSTKPEVHPHFAAHNKTRPTLAIFIEIFTTTKFHEIHITTFVAHCFLQNILRAAIKKNQLEFPGNLFG